MEDLIERSRKRFEALDLIVKQAQAVGEEYHKLRSFLEQADQVAQLLDPKKSVPPSPASSKDTKPHKPPLKNAHGTVMTADLAEYVLKLHGPRLHLNKMIELMHTEGWEGSGDARRDYKSAYQNLNDKKKRFHNVGENIWELVQVTDAAKKILP
jgi:hypothetical protein